MPTETLCEDDVMEEAREFSDHGRGDINACSDGIAHALVADAPVVHPMLNLQHQEAEQLSFFPHQEFEHEEAFRAMLRKVLPTGAPIVLSILNKLDLEGDCFIADGLAWDGARLRLELRGVPRRGIKALLRWIAEPNEVSFGYDSRAKKWRRHQSIVGVVDSKRCNFTRVISLEKRKVAFKVAA